jgi:hypothetical protein
MPETVRGAVPVFFRVADWDALVVPTSCEPKARLVGVSVTAGAGAAPDPPSVTACGAPGASSAMLTFAARLPAVVGEKVTVIVHVAFTSSEGGQSFVWPKSPGSLPASPMLVMPSGALPLFLSVAVCAVLVVPTSCEPKARLAGVSVTAGAGAPPVPLRGNA